MVLHHVQLFVTSLLEAKKFYLAALAPLAYKEIYAVEDIIVGLGADAPDLWLSPVKGSEGSPQRGVHIAFKAETKEIVDQFHEAALKAGAKDNGAPGVTNCGGGYAAFVLDSDGNNIEVVYV